MTAHVVLSLRGAVDHGLGRRAMRWVPELSTRPEPALDGWLFEGYGRVCCSAAVPFVAVGGLCPWHPAVES